MRNTHTHIKRGMIVGLLLTSWGLWAIEPMDATEGVVEENHTPTQTLSYTNDDALEIASMEQRDGQGTQVKGDVQRSDTFGYLGHEYELRLFEGIGAVPLHTPYVYEWGTLPNHYLIEQVSPAGETITALTVGDQVSVKGEVYTITHMLTHVENDSEATRYLKQHPAALTFQTCEEAWDANGNNLLRIWFAN